MFGSSTTHHLGSSSTRRTSRQPKNWLTTCFTWTATRRSTSRYSRRRISTNTFTKTTRFVQRMVKWCTCIIITKPWACARCVEGSGIWTRTGSPFRTLWSGSTKKTVILPVMWNEMTVTKWKKSNGGDTSLPGVVKTELTKSVLKKQFETHIRVKALTHPYASENCVLWSFPLQRNST